MNRPNIYSSLKMLSALVMMTASITLSTNSYSDDTEMTFFITSEGVGDGANLGGLEGADEHCADLADDAGSKLTNWKAYLSLTPKVDRSGEKPKVIPGVNARDRIGNGPWHNAKGELIAKNIEDLHSEKNSINKDSGLDEHGKTVNFRGMKPNKHDILTGSDPQGRYSTAGGDTTCKGWTNNEEGSAIVGHHDRQGLSEDWHMLSWNSAHGSLGCDQESLIKTGGDGLFYCFHAIE